MPQRNTHNGSTMCRIVMSCCQCFNVPVSSCGLVESGIHEVCSVTRGYWWICNLFTGIGDDYKSYCYDPGVNGGSYDNLKCCVTHKHVVRKVLAALWRYRYWGRYQTCGYIGIYTTIQFHTIFTHGKVFAFSTIMTWTIFLLPICMGISPYSIEPQLQAV